MPPAGGYSTSQFTDIPGMGQVKLASFGNRVVGYLIDVGVLIIPLIIIYAIFAALFIKAATIDYTIDPETGFRTANVAAGSGAIASFFVLFIVAIFVPIAYFVVLIAIRGQTVGGMVMGIKCVREEDGGLLGYGRAIKRYALPFLVGLVPFVGGLLSLGVYFSPLWDDRKRLQGYHDKWAGDLVISLK